MRSIWDIQHSAIPPSTNLHDHMREFILFCNVLFYKDLNMHVTGGQFEKVCLCLFFYPNYNDSNDTVIFLTNVVNSISQSQPK